MKAKINYNICDNSPACGAITICPVKAVSWTKEKGLSIDAEKCIGCGMCIGTCPVGAISVGDGEEIEKDPKKIAELFVERYGCEAIDEKILIKESEFNELIKTSKGLVVGELFNDDSIQCLVKSIPISELFTEVKYYKVRVETEYENLPMMVIYKDGELLGKIEGFFGTENKKEIIDKINEIINK